MCHSQFSSFKSPRARIGKIKALLMDNPSYREQARKRPITSRGLVRIQVNPIWDHRDLDAGVEGLCQLAQPHAVGNHRGSIAPDDPQKGSDQPVVDLKVIRAESRHVTAAQQGNIGNVI